MLAVLHLAVVLSGSGSSAPPIQPPSQQDESTASAVADFQVLRPGDVVEGTIAEIDPVVATDVLRAKYASSVCRGRSYGLEVPRSVSVTVELRSYFFDAYLVLRDSEGRILAEDDDGLLGAHARIVVEANEADRSLHLDIVALNDRMGDFEVTVIEGIPRALTAQERRAAERANATRRVEVMEAKLGPDHASTAMSLNQLVVLLYTQGDYQSARTHCERALAIREAVLGANHPDVASSLSNLASILMAQGEFQAALPIYERALAVSEASAGPDSLQVAAVLHAFSQLLANLGENGDARLHMERALEIREASLEPGHPDIATSLSTLASLLKELGDLEGARPLDERALAIREVSPGPQHPDTAVSLHNLGFLLHAQGDFEGARPLYERALAICETSLGPGHPMVASVLNSLGSLLDDQGDAEGARPLMERALAIRESSLGPWHTDTAQSLNNLSKVLTSLGDSERAHSLLERALAIHERALGPNHPSVAAFLNNLAVHLANDHQDYDGALPLIERALAIAEATLGPRHPHIAKNLDTLALTKRALGDLEAARPLMERALEIHEESVGPDHPSTARSLKNLSLLLLDQGEDAAARALSKRAIESREAHRQRLDWALTESERILLAGQQRETVHIYLGLARGGDSELERERYGALLRWKGHVLRGLVQSRGQALAGLSMVDQQRVESLRILQRKLSRELFRKDVGDRTTHQERLGRMRVERQELERELSRSLGAQEESPAVGLAELAQTLPADAVLVDFLVHPVYIPARREGERIVAPGHWSAPRLSAWILHPGEGGALERVDLGNAARIEDATKQFLEALVASRGVAITDGPSTSTVANDALFAALWSPIQERIDRERGTAAPKQVFVSPDSFLGTLPFEVLQQDDGRFLIERFAFVYLQDALSIAALSDPAHGAAPAEGAPTLLCVGGVDFRKRGDLSWRTEALEQGAEGLSELDRAAPDPSFSASTGLRGGFRSRWSPLPATRDEALGIADIHAEAFEAGRRLVLLRDVATEERVKHELPRHQVLHLATHGFFQPEGLPSMWEQASSGSGSTEMVMRLEERRLTGLMPGLLSGLVLAGANREEPDPARDDGLLTAEELSFLDLSNVDLVVLSACESGLGRPQGGEGMLGFRRTLRSAGAKTVISSLWRVSDESTNELMQSFYERLWLQGQSKIDALRGAQLEMLKRARIENEGEALPSTWGAFVLDGAWR